MRVRLRILLSVPWLALAAWPAVAQSQATAVVADVGSPRALGTTVARNGGFLTIDGGARAGNNLFHSFSQFTLAAGETARWVRAAGDGATLNNVISRVTGGQASLIAGTLDSTGLPNASFFFINPAGIVFGDSARVNVPAAAYFSTAAELRFADTARFAVSAPNGSTLSMAAPESFGFVGGQGAIEVRNAGSGFATPTTRLSFSGSTVGLTNATLNLGSRLVAGGVDVVGVGAGADIVTLADPLDRVHIGAITMRNTPVVITSGDSLAGAFRIGGGVVILDGADVISDTGGVARGGDIRIRADQLQLTSSSQIISSARAAGAGGDIVLSGREITADSLRLSSVTTTAARGGAITLAATGVLSVGGQSFLTSTSSGTGAGGGVALTARSLLLEGVFVISSALGDGAGGLITVSAPVMRLFDANLIAVSLNAARPGDVRVDGRSIEISGGSFGSVPGAIGDSGAVDITASSNLSVFGAAFTASSASDNGAGSITLRSPEMILTESRIQADNSGNGGAGSVIIEADTLVLDQVSIRAEVNGAPGDRLGLIRLKSTGDLRMVNSIITSNTNDRANGGIVEVIGRDVRLEDSRLVSDTIGRATGNAGVVTVKADTLLVRNGLISSGTNSRGAGGDVFLDARTILLDTAAAVRSDANDEGDAGQVSIRAGSLTVIESGAITSRARSGIGDAGNVTIDAGTITIVDGRISTGTETSGAAGTVTIRVGELLLDSERRDLTFISSETLGEGDAGDVVIDAKSVVVRNGALISSDAFNTGNAGTIRISTDTLTVQDGGSISSDSTATGDAGDVFITAGALTVQGNGFDGTFISSDALGGGDAGGVTIVAKSVTVSQSGYISSDTYSSGAGGDISIKADALGLQSFGAISSRTFSEGRAGNVIVTAGTLSLAGGSAISSEATEESAGNAGFVGITADTVSVATRSLISTASRGGGDAGEVGIRAKTLTLDAALISSSAGRGSRGASGSLTITADALKVHNGGTISTVSNNPHPAGQIQIVTGALSVVGPQSQISSENLAGAVALGNPRGQSGDAGSVVITADGMTLSNGGRITTNAFGGAAGEITITIDRPGLLVLKGDGTPGVIQTSSGAATGGKITISDPLAIISNGGSILALGQQRGANVVIRSRYFINSTDRANTVEVDGDIRLETGLYDVSSGTVNRELSVLDASKVLRGQCPAARSTGAVSQLITRPVGPYVREPEFARPSPRGALVSAISVTCP